MEFLDNIIKHIDLFLSKHAETNEHALIQHLICEQVDPISQLDLKQSKDLFGAHFLTRHALYRLQDRYFNNRTHTLELSLTKISRRCYTSGSHDLSHHDAVKDYYLDFENYLKTTEEEVNEMLKTFWERYVAHESRYEDYQTLGLPLDASYKDVKKRYRELAQQHHPDKGGDQTLFSKLSQAKSNIEKALAYEKGTSDRP